MRRLPAYFDNPEYHKNVKLSTRETVIHVEIGSSESKDSHSQKPVSPSDKRASLIQHF